ncbi:hypothetical protein QF028_003068 [Neobacillus sp. B4I6]|uniref:hypothetical protein n=1 Tax=Neobacillus sp. B4I6 TaxID=3373925 RepID=UPI003D1B47C2
MNVATNNEMAMETAIKDLLNGLYWNNETMTFETEVGGRYTDLYESMNNLSKKQREVIYWYYFRGYGFKNLEGKMENPCNDKHGMAFQYIGEMMGKTGESARKSTEQLHNRAIEKLFELLKTSKLAKGREKRSVPSVK